MNNTTALKQSQKIVRLFAGLFSQILVWEDIVDLRSKGVNV